MNLTDTNFTQRHNSIEESKSVPFGYLWTSVTWFTLAIAGNITIVVLMKKDNKLRTVVGKLSLNQLVADGASITMVLLLYVCKVISFKDKSIYQLMFTTVRALTFLLYSESLQTQGATSFSLYMAICHSIKYKIHNTTDNLVIFIASTWIINIIVASLIFAADDALVHDDFMLIGFCTLKPEEIWYSILKSIAMFSLPLLAIFSFIKICRYKKAIGRGEVVAAPHTNLIIRQACGSFVVFVVHATGILVQIVVENTSTIHPAFAPGSAVLYLFFLLKLPLFLFSFNRYRKVFKTMFCPCLSSNQLQPLPYENNLTPDQLQGMCSSNQATNVRLHQNPCHDNWTPSSAATSKLLTASKHMQIHRQQTNLPNVEETGFEGGKKMAIPVREAWVMSNSTVNA